MRRTQLILALAIAALPACKSKEHKCLTACVASLNSARCLAMANRDCQLSRTDGCKARHFESWRARIKLYLRDRKHIWALDLSIGGS